MTVEDLRPCPNIWCDKRGQVFRGTVGLKRHLAFCNHSHEASENLAMQLAAEESIPSRRFLPRPVVSVEELMKSEAEYDSDEWDETFEASGYTYVGSRKRKSPSSEEKKYAPDCILGHKIQDGQILLHIRWKRSKVTTWEPAQKFSEDATDMALQYHARIEKDLIDHLVDT